jgi:hypothetical protein
MRKLTFLLEEDTEQFAGTVYPGREIKHVHTDIEYLPDVLARFKEFLQGVGYVIDGELDVVDVFNQTTHEDEHEAQDTDMDGC